MTEINTFSSLIDNAIARSKRRDRLADIISAARLTMRELQSKAQFDADLIEDVITADDDPYVWELPSNYRIMIAVEYPGCIDGHGNTVFPREARPSRNQQHHEYVFYRSGQVIVFGGHGAGTNGDANINIAYLTYFAPLQYYQTEADRPARFILEDNAWEYHEDYVTDEEQETARELSTNWILERWFDYVLEGTLAKVYKLVGDERAVPTYALYRSIDDAFMNGEAMASSSVAAA